MNREVHLEEGLRDRHKTVPTVRLPDTTAAAALAVMQALFEAEIAEACGPKGKHDANRAAVRHGQGRGSVTLGGRKGRGDPPRAQTVDGHEVPLTSYAHFAADDLPACSSAPAV